MIELLIASPIPVPPGFQAANGSKMLSIISGSMPGPRSAIEPWTTAAAFLVSMSRLRASRWMDPYLAAGAEWHDQDIGTGVTERRTDFWGLGIGVKNYGFFDIERFKYVQEIGAGSF